MSADHIRNRFFICVNNAEYPVSLEARKVYTSIDDPAAEASGLLRIIDESGDDYLYPQSSFVAVDLTPAAADAVLTSIGGGAT